jgi:hypothetical protein
MAPDRRHPRPWKGESVIAALGQKIVRKGRKKSGFPLTEGFFPTGPCGKWHRKREKTLYTSATGPKSPPQARLRAPPINQTNLKEYL